MRTSRADSPSMSMVCENLQALSPVHCLQSQRNACSYVYASKLITLMVWHFMQKESSLRLTAYRTVSSDRFNRMLAGRILWLVVTLARLVPLTCTKGSYYVSCCMDLKSAGYGHDSRLRSSNGLNYLAIMGNIWGETVDGRQRFEENE
jgi:hypothetical protein